ncbi:hypothetical protein RO3G_07417 [Rhizopus delemar RA 99-880]|uniref:Uncharacterized protein n=1 Tax=Rhizopus delemar (strain RA 99-880 / ATCC MYA-4621 / FGSC 9543 / NRRL 43880) TaxID=246409 RepID=I1C2N2_RHIO9|nr:hypothetical protein RO3G_07417 [Rhizopus delemar RA 99-880]|eukprot:EIE82712.1 hypothetical protein RO3G_07417 [Rhizopus delemar RA 99-880]
MTSKKSIETNFNLITKTHHTMREIVELAGLNKSTVQDIKAKADHYGNMVLKK